MRVGGEWDVVRMWVEQEGNWCLEVVRSIWDFSGVLKTGRIRSDLVLARFDEFEPVEKLHSFAVDAAW